jgi:hypothetical protein
MSLSISFSRRIPLLLSLAVLLCAEDKTAQHQLWSELEASVLEGRRRSPSSTSIVRGGELTLAQSDILDEKERQHISGDTRVAFQKKVGLDHVYDDSKEQRHTLQSGTVGNRNLIRNDEFFYDHWEPPPIDRPVRFFCGRLNRQMVKFFYGRLIHLLLHRHQMRLPVASHGQHPHFPLHRKPHAPTIDL